MAIDSYSRVVRDLLSAYRTSPPGLSTSFILRDKHGALSNIGIELFRDPTKLRRAAISLIEIEPTILQGEPIPEIVSSLEHFFMFCTHLIDHNRILTALRASTSIFEITQPEAIDLIAVSLKEFLQKEYELQVYLVPVNRVSVRHEIVSDDLILLCPQQNIGRLLDFSDSLQRQIDGELFPPFDFKGKRAPLTQRDCWLGCRARSEFAAIAKFQRLIGALFLVLEFPSSTLHSAPGSLRGWTKISSTGRIALNMHAIGPPTLLDAQSLERSAIEQMEKLISSTELVGKLRSRTNVALEFLSGAWSSDGVLPFMQYAIAFDALFGVRQSVRESIINGVGSNAGHISKVKERMGYLLDLRNALLHGEISSIEQSQRYVSYYDKFNADPRSDQIKILREAIFGVLNGTK